MDYLILVMILAGSALMVYNVFRYGVFIKRNGELEHEVTHRWLIGVPLLLLVFFLVGYLVIGASGIADLMIASILLGGSVFVFLLLRIMFAIIESQWHTQRVLAARFDEIKQEMGTLTKNALTVLRVDLTTDEVEERSGDGLYDSDDALDKYSELAAARAGHILSGGDGALFSRQGLLDQYNAGMTSVSQVVLSRRRDGSASYVKLEATLTKKPVSGNVVAFIVETPYNVEAVQTALFEKVLMSEYNRIAYVIDGNYHVLISNVGKKKGMIISDNDDDSYESIYFNSFLPALAEGAVPPGAPNPLRLSVIEKELESKDLYEVDAPFVVDGELHYKHFAFYNIDRKTKFFLMLLTDSTGVREEQEKRNRELTEALDAAVRSNESKIRFFNGISEELRTPLNAMLGFAELASQQNDPEQTHSFLSKITSAGRSLQLRLGDLFDMSRIISDQLTLNEETADVAALSEEIAARIAGEYPAKNLNVRVDLSGLTDRRAVCDGTRLTQILDRLLKNSAVYAPDNSAVTLTVAQDGDGYIFSVANKGKPIPEDVAAHIFEAETWENSELSAAGSGMAVAGALISKMNGKAEVHSGDDGTVVFNIRLPLAPVPDKDAPAGTLPPLRLLVADDNEINREIASLILAGDGHTVDLAVDGKDALEKAKSGGYDAILMDVQMPVMNGYEATAAIRALPDPAVAGLPIIAMTANAYLEDRTDTERAGMDGYVPKPIDPNETRAVLAKVLADKGVLK